jgi:hypothetical protein
MRIAKAQKRERGAKLIARIPFNLIVHFSNFACYFGLRSKIIWFKRIFDILIWQLIKSIPKGYLYVLNLLFHSYLKNDPEFQSKNIRTHDLPRRELSFLLLFSSNPITTRRKNGEIDFDRKCL